MVDGPAAPEHSWEPSDSSEPNAEPLRRAIARVEELIRRLDYAPEVKVEHLDLGESTPPLLPASGPESATRAPTSDSLAPPATPSVTTATQAEALRITLSAHDEVNRLLAEAAQLRSAAAAEGHRILTDAQALADNLRAEASADAEGVRGEAASAAADMRAEAKRSMRAAIADAAAEANEVRSAAAAEAQRVRTEAAAWSADQRETAEALAAQARKQAERDADHIRDVAAERGRLEAERKVAAEVETALADARGEVEVARAEVGRAATIASGQLDTAREVLAAFLASSSASTSSLATVLSELDVLCDAVAAYTPLAPNVDTVQDAAAKPDQVAPTVPPSEPAHDEHTSTGPGGGAANTDSVAAVESEASDAGETPGGESHQVLVATAAAADLPPDGDPEATPIGEPNDQLTADTDQLSVDTLVEDPVSDDESPELKTSQPAQPDPDPPDRAASEQETEAPETANTSPTRSHSKGKSGRPLGALFRGDTR